MRVWVLVGFFAGRMLAADPVPVMIQSAPGRFEISAMDASVAHAIATDAEQGWRILAPVLGLPEAFSSPIYLRVETTAPRSGPERAPFRLAIEAGGIVSVRLRAEEVTPAVVRRALVQGMVMRIAVARHGAARQLHCPRWLELGAVEWWQTRAEAAKLDAKKQAAARSRPVPIETLMLWTQDAPASTDWAEAAFWLLTVLQLESGRGKEWVTLLDRLTVGDDPLIALVESYPGRFDNPRDRELWWQTGFHHARRIRTLPSLDAEESRAHIGALARFVFQGSDEHTDRIVSVRELLSGNSDPFVTAEFGRRKAELTKMISALHPFYRNAGLALAECFSARGAEPKRVAQVAATFEQDWRDANELEAATTAALDRLERR